MPTPASCADAQVLNRLVTGLLPDPEIALLEEHLLYCERCAGALNTLVAQDTLLADLKAQKSAPKEQLDEAVRGLIQRLRGLRVSGVSSPAQEATVGAAAANAPTPGEGTQAPDSPTSNLTQELSDFLTPSRGPGEIGWLAGYRVLKVLGSGGMGVVFLAEDPTLKRQVALKAMLPAVAASASARQRFLREAQATAAIENDHIVSIYQVSEDRSIPFLAMPVLKGAPLDQWLERGHKATVAQILRMGRETAKGLAAAHAKGLIHRDIKPGNIWLEAPQGRVKILDFGLARAVDDKTHLTQTGAVAGTPAFMAPEQAKGDPIDHRCDLFSLGCVLYRLCTGQLPFTGANSLAVLTALALHDPKPVRELNPDIPPALSDLVMQLLAKDPAQRTATAKAVVQAIQAIERSLAGPGAVMAVSTVAVDAANPPQELTEAISPLAASPEAGAKPAAQSAAAGLDKPQPSAVRGSRRRGPLLVAVAALLLGGVALAGWVIIRDKDGKIVARVPIPKDGSAKVQGDDQPLQAGTSPFDALKRETISAEMMKWIGGGDPALIPKELVGVFGNSQESDCVNSLHISPDGRRIYLSTDEKRLLRVWDTVSGKEREELRKTDVRYASLSLDGKRLLRCVNLNTLLIADTASGADLRTLTGSSFPAAALSPDGSRLVSSQGKGRLQVWDATEGKKLFILDGHGTYVAYLAYSPDGKRVATRARGEVKVWDADTGKELPHLRLETSLSANDHYAPTFSPDSAKLAVRTPKGIVLFDVVNGRELVALKLFSKCFAIAPSPDGKQFATATVDFVTIWDAFTGNQLFHWKVRPNTIARLAYAPDGRHILFGTQEGNVQVLRLAKR